MGEPLKNHYGPEIAHKIAAMIQEVYPGFDTESFVRDALVGYEELELTPRAKQIGRTLQRHLPPSYPEAIAILIGSLGPTLEDQSLTGLGSFVYMPHVFFVAEFGLEHFEESMQAQYELTQRFTAEFSVRSYIQKYPEATMDRLKSWATDPSVHVRRLVSEGTRPRLPWASRLPDFQKDPTPVLALLELLKDDPELYVRRSVANNLNDIGKDHPDVLVAIARKWMKGASEDRQWLIRHALRSAVKRGDSGALAILGYGDDAGLSVGQVRINPSTATMGASVSIRLAVTNDNAESRRVMVDCRVHFVKANGKASPKVFKLKALDLSPGETVDVGKSISLAEMTTRKHYPGIHEVDVVLNGVIKKVGSFELVGE